MKLGGKYKHTLATVSSKESISAQTNECIDVDVNTSAVIFTR